MAELRGEPVDAADGEKTSRKMASEKRNQLKDGGREVRAQTRAEKWSEPGWRRVAVVVGG